MFTKFNLINGICSCLQEEDQANGFSRMHKNANAKSELTSEEQDHG